MFRCGRARLLRPLWADVKTMLRRRFFRAACQITDDRPDLDELAWRAEQARIEDHRDQVAAELALERGLALMEAEGIARAERQLNPPAPG